MSILNLLTPRDVIYWITLTLIITGLAHAYRRSAGGWFVWGLLGGPITLMVLIFKGKISKSGY